MADVKREISGFFLSPQKFASHVSALSSPDCTTAHLRLFHNEPQHTSAILDSLSRNTSVTSFDLFELDAASAVLLSNVLSTSPRLASLSVHHPHGHDAVANLCHGIATSRTLKSLHLSYLDARSVTALATALLAWSPFPAPHLNLPPDALGGGSPRLRNLHLSKCLISPDAATALSEALVRQSDALTQLKVVETDLNDLAVEALFSVPGWATPHGITAALTSLDLSSCQVGPRGASQLGTFLAACPHIHSLTLANNKLLACQGTHALVSGLANNRNIRRLDLSGCGLGVAGTQALVAALLPMAAGSSGDDAGCAQLEELMLGHNSVGAMGLAALLTAMSGAGPCSLRKLQLDHNRIAGRELTEALRLTATRPLGEAEVEVLPRVTAPLQQLLLAGNALYDVGVATVAACLAGAPYLELLDLRENGISDVGVTMLLPLITPRGAGGGGRGGARSSGGGGSGCLVASGAGLQGLLLDCNRLHNSGAQELLAAVMAAPQLWRFSAEGNKLTDPALRLSLSQLSQLRAARHSQLAVLGRYYSSSSSSSMSEDGNGTASAADRYSGGSGGGDRDHISHEVTSSAMNMDVVGVAEAIAQPSRSLPVSDGAMQTVSLLAHQLKHRREEEESGAEEGGSDGGDKSPPPPQRNVAQRVPGGESEGGGGCLVAFDQSGGGPLHHACMPQSSGGGGDGSASLTAGLDSCRSVGYALPAFCVATSYEAASSLHSDGAMLVDVPCGCDGIQHFTAALTTACEAAAAACGSSNNSSPVQCGSPPSPPSAMCFVTAVTGVGSAASVAVSKQGVDTANPAHPHPQPATAAMKGTGCLRQVLPACRRPRYKPLTPEQQRLFVDF